MLALIFAAALAGTPATKPKAAPVEGWVNTQSKDAMTDKITYSARLQNATGGLITISCDAGKNDSVSFAVTSPRVLPHTTVRLDDITFRLDQSPAVRDRWAYSGYTAMLANTNASTPFLTPMITSKVLLVRMYGSDGSSVDESFDVSRSSIAALSLLRSCGLTS